MFERYTEAARRALFFSRYEASQLGSISIEPEHLLLGLVRDGDALSSLTPEATPLTRIRTELERRVGSHEKVSTSVEIPFSTATKDVLVGAAREADALAHAHIGIEHLLLGLLREEKSGAAAVLAAHGVRLDDVRGKVGKLQGPLEPSRQTPEMFQTETPPQRVPLSQIDGMKRLLGQLEQATADNPEAQNLISLLDAALDTLRANLGG
jgi:ATP-dependent Clp protease ATP-binding subunit ClpC